jgi:hypothetical protein
MKVLSVSSPLFSAQTLKVTADSWTMMKSHRPHPHLLLHRTDLVQQFRGRVVDTPGDNILTEFTSVVDAVGCAVELQEELQVRNVDLPDNRRMEFRIGVNLGDVVEAGDRI